VDGQCAGEVEVEVEVEVSVGDGANSSTLPYVDALSSPLRACLGPPGSRTPPPYVLM
jgi:hypothetical protein